MSKKALVAMSGGVDSSVAAYLAKKQGFECIGCTMKLYTNDDAYVETGRTCCSLDDVSDARAIAFKLGMRYYVFNFTDEFRKKIIDKFVKSYQNGMTPNPCIDCNRYMKFEKLFERADILGCDYIVTGHYARIEYVNGKFILKKAIDETKDQSYVLYSMTQNALCRTLFPLGAIKKEQTRIIAGENGFINAKKPDSQDICFVPDGDYVSVIENYSKTKSKKGSFVDLSGNIIAEHKGIVYYTIGQRRGLSVSFNEPRYVCKICPQNNTVVLGREKDLYKTKLTAADFNWISGKPPKKQFRCAAKIRYRQKEQPALVTVLDEKMVSVEFDEPQRAVTPGQALVLYDGNIVLGGGEIQRDY